MVLTAPPSGFKQKKLVYGPYSPSRLLVATCPSRFFAQYIRKDAVIGATVASARGSAIHEILAKITAAHMEKRALTSMQVGQWVSEAVAKYPAAYAQIELIRASADAYVANPNPYITANTFCEASFAVQLFEEESFFDEAVNDRKFVAVRYDMPNGRTNPEAYFGGRIDQLCVDEDLKIVTIIDHKSTPSANKNDDFTFQLGAYAWLVSLFYPGYQIQTLIHYAHPSLNMYGPPEIWTARDLELHGEHIMMRIDALEAMQSFDQAVSGDHCSYCHITQECPLLQREMEQKSKGLLDLNIRSHDDAVRVAGTIPPMEAELARRKRLLKTYVNTSCPTTGVSVEGITYGNKPDQESVDWEATDKKIGEESRRAEVLLGEGRFSGEDERRSLEEVARLKNLDGLFQRYGLRPDYFKTYNGQLLRNIHRLDNGERVIEALSKFVVKTRKTRFMGYKS
jgi:hypothetical protein